MRDFLDFIHSLIIFACYYKDKNGVFCDLRNIRAKTQLSQRIALLRCYSTHRKRVCGNERDCNSTNNRLIFYFAYGILCI